MKHSHPRVRPYIRTLISLTVVLSACTGPGEDGSRQSRSERHATASAHRQWDEIAALADGVAVRRSAEALAADEMRGRETATAGYERAAGWVASRFEALGLAPVGGGGTYFQEVDLFETRIVPTDSMLTLERAATVLELAIRDDYVRGGGFGAPEEATAAGLAFAGYGVVAPEYEHDDYAEIDLKGKVAVVFRGAPPDFETDLRAYYSASTVKQATASARGALGLMTVRTPADQARVSWDRRSSSLGEPWMGWVDSEGVPHQGFPELTGNASLSDDAALQLFELAGHDLSGLFERHGEGATGSFDLDVRARFKRRSLQRRVSSPNVLGMIEGSDAKLKDEYVVLTAHLDHLGVGDADSDSALYNGFYDNAVGVATLLEVAHAMRRLKWPPRRSVLFVALTAEEQGLLGSSFFAHNPPVPVEQIVANLNMDMPFLGFPIAEVEAFGAEHSSLGEAVEFAAHTVGIDLTPDSMPDRVRFVRSDQFSFVQQGIPALALKPGGRSSNDTIDGQSMLLDFLNSHYHRPSDDSQLPYSAEGARRFAATALLTALFVADDQERPRWNDGDFFGEKFASASR